jgi:biopolymer transport protein ExbD
MDLGSRNKIKIEAGMSSMTDLVFLLLIFFIIMSIMSNEYTPVDLPNPDVAPPKVTDSVTPTVVITEDNQYVVLPGGSMDTPMTFEDIMGLADAAVTSSNKMKLKIAGHRLADYEAVFRVLALCQANGWDPVLAYDQ